MPALKPVELRSYGLLALPLAVVGLPLYMHVPDFYVTEKGLSLSAIGIVLLLVRIFDAVQDPLIGALSDHYARYRRAAMLGAVALLGLGMLALLVPPGEAGIAWFTGWVIVATSAYSFSTINLNTIGGIWSGDRYERTRIASTRERFGLIGVSLGVLVPGVLAAIYSKATAFAVFSIVLLVILGYAGWRFLSWSASNAALVGGGTNAGPVLRNLRIPQDPRVRQLVLVSFMGALASAFPAVLFLFFVRDLLGREDLAWLFLILYFVCALLGVPVWRDLSRQAGKVKAWCLSIGCAVAAFTGAAFAGEGDLLLYGVVCLLTGLALGGDLIFPASLMADLVGSEQERSTHASAGYAWLSFVQKAGLGVAAGVAFPVLGWTGFQSGEANGPEQLRGLILLYAIIPLVLKLLAGMLLWSWRARLEDQSIYEENTHPNRNRALVTGPDSNRIP